MTDINRIDNHATHTVKYDAHGSHCTRCHASGIDLGRSPCPYHVKEPAPEFDSSRGHKPILAEEPAAALTAPADEWRDNHFIAGMARVANQVRELGHAAVADKIMKLLGDRFADDTAPAHPVRWAVSWKYQNDVTIEGDFPTQEEAALFVKMTPAIGIPGITDVTVVPLYAAPPPDRWRAVAGGLAKAVKTYFDSGYDQAMSEALAAYAAAKEGKP